MHFSQLHPELTEQELAQRGVQGKLVHGPVALKFILPVTHAEMSASCCSQGCGAVMLGLGTAEQYRLLSIWGYRLSRKKSNGVS